MSKRFGRNQRRQAREFIRSLQEEVRQERSENLRMAQYVTSLRARERMDEYKTPVTLVLDPKGRDWVAMQDAVRSYEVAGFFAVRTYIFQHQGAFHFRIH